MKKLIITEPGHVEFEEIKKNQLLPTQVRVNVKRVSLCGSDYKLFKGKYNAPEKYPICFGHEWSGKITETGEEVKKVSVGDKVTGDCSIYCDRCVNCSFDKNLCDNIKKFGITVDGFAAEEVVVDERYIYKAPDNISYKVLTLTEPVAVVFHAISLLGSCDNKKKILIYGCGALGMITYLVFKYKIKNFDITVCDINDDKIDYLEQLVGSKVKRINKKTNKNDSYEELYNNNGYDIIFEMSGDKDAFNEALQQVNPNGTIITVGMYGNIDVNIGLITVKKLCVMGSIGGTGEFEKAILFLDENQDIFGKLVTSEFPFEKAEDAFNEMAKKKMDIKRQIIINDYDNI